MNFDQAKAACDKIVALGEKLLEYPSPDVARELEQVCGYQRTQMRGRFGNVGEQLTRTITAAKRYQKSRVDVISANMELHSALTRIGMALRLVDDQPTAGPWIASHHTGRLRASVRRYRRSRGCGSGSGSAGAGHGLRTDPPF